MNLAGDLSPVGFLESGKDDRVTQRKPMTFHAWQNVRRKDPRRYYNAKNQRLIAEDRAALGPDGFFATEAPMDAEALELQSAVSQLED